MKIITVETDKGLQLTVGDTVRTTRRIGWREGVIESFTLSNSVFMPCRALVVGLDGSGYESIEQLRKVGHDNRRQDRNRGHRGSTTLATHGAERQRGFVERVERRAPPGAISAVTDWTPQEYKKLNSGLRWDGEWHIVNMTTRESLESWPTERQARFFCESVNEHERLNNRPDNYVVEHHERNWRKG